MLKVNEEKLLQDREYLLEVKRQNIVKIKEDSKAFALTQNWDEATTEEFVEFVARKHNFGLSIDEDTKLSILNLYIEEIPDDREGELEDSVDTVRLNVV